MNYRSKEWFILLVALAGSIKVIAASFGYHLTDEELDAYLNVIGFIVTVGGIIYKTTSYNKLKDSLTKKKQP
jgi:hypothetical protein